MKGTRSTPTAPLRTPARRAHSSCAQHSIGPLERLLAIAPMLEIRRLAKAGEHSTSTALRGKHTLGQLARDAARKRKVSVMSIWRWYGRFIRSGYDALARHPRADKGTIRFFATHPAAARLVARESGKGVSTRLIYVALCRRFKQRVCSYTILRAFLRSLPKPPGQACARQQSRRRAAGRKAVTR